MATIALDAAELDDVVGRVTRAVLAELRRQTEVSQRDASRRAAAQREAPRPISADGAKCLSPADKHYGYELGCDGTLDREEAIAFLKVSRTSLWRLAQAGQIRKSKVLGRVVYCRRSLLNYLKPNEE